MVSVDEWNAADERAHRPWARTGLGPGATEVIALLLPGNGCEWLALSREACHTPRLSVSWR
jgi:hypothetical protein